ncbi:DMT family transporter [Rhizobium sp. TRM95111]|uniref:DMT family transporter n=1 Tax=Rhizobium alarense TaxID=2846851 RepID=UPI001F31CD7F|nr:DMT family transporter [Rhizobium alarense]MCF3642825.1 DMT family transporter [Rhizobium alarense]
MENSRRRGIIEMAAAMAISGTIGWFVTMSGKPVADIVFWRCAIGAAVLAAVCFSMGMLKREFLPARRVAIAMLGGVAIVINWLLLFAAYPMATISVATTVYNTQPFMLLLLGAIVFRERITGAKLFWLLLSFAGMVAIVKGKPALGGPGGDYALGILLALGAAFFYALAAIAAKGLKGMPPHLIALIQVSTGAAMLAPFADFSALPDGSIAWGSLATLGIVHTGLMYVLLYGAIQKLPTHLTGSLSFIYPVAAIVVDRIAFGHVLQPLQILGSAVILLSAAGMTLGWRLPFSSRLRTEERISP